MEKLLKKGFMSVLSFLLVFTTFSQLITKAAAIEEYENIALNKSVTVSGATTGNEGTKAVDGNKDTKWEVGNINTNPTIIVDLGKEENFEKIALKWASNFAFRYKIYIAKSDLKYNQILFHEEGTGGDEEWEMNKNNLARYVKIELIEAKNGETKIGLNELEVLRLKKDVGDNPVNIALNKPAYASANEAGLARLGPSGAFDGKYSNPSNERWSSGNITQNPQWIYVDLEAEMSFSAIHIFWESAYATKYVIQYSNDTGENKNWTTFITMDNGQGSWEKYDFDSITARYVRLYATASNGVGSAKPISIWEMEIYKNVNDSLTVEDVAKDFKIETITSQMNKMPAYYYDNNNIVAEMFCSDTDFVVEDNGIIHTPLVDKEVLVTYLIKDKRTNVTKEIRNISVTIPGRKAVSLDGNKKPVTVPTIQEWQGAVGTYQLTNKSRIIVQDETLKKAAQITKMDIEDLFGLELEIASDTPKTGDIFLTKENADTTIGDQGYTLLIDDVITIRATSYQGVFFGTRSVLQALVASGEALTINKGEARDYAKYEYRKFMLDVARKYMPMWYLKDFVKYASWFKFTDIQVHLNDTSYNGHSRFRLESDIPNLTAPDGYYTKDEYRDFQYYAEDYGVRIVSEFDTPAHSGVFIDNDPDLGFDATHLDIRLNSAKKDTVYKFIADLYEEYMGGENPVFVTDAFNVGLDEFNSAYKEDMTQYTQYVMDLVYNKYGKTPLAWASMGCVDSSTTKIPDYPIMDAWANYAISLKSLFDQDYKLINATNKYGYIVPGGNNGYPDFAKEEEMYDNLSAGKFRDKNNAGIDVAEGHPKIVGGSISLWNDRGIYNGISIYDVFARTQSILPIYAQTFWYGRDEDKSYNEFKDEVTTLGSGPNVTVDKKIASKTEKVYDFDMESTAKQGKDLIIKDNSGNGYDATAVNATVTSTDEGQALQFNGNGYLKMQHSALKWPYTLAFDLKIDESQTGDIILFEETMPQEQCNQWIDTKYQTRKIYLKEIDGKYQLMYDRDNYHFEHNLKLEKGKLYQLSFTSDKKYTSVYIDGIVKSTINGPILTNSGNKWYDSASINLPLQKIGQNLIGTLDNIKVYNTQLNNEAIKNLYDSGIDVIHENIALNKDAIASSSYTDYQTPNKAFDGIINQTASGPEQSRWASSRTHDQWIQVDLNKVYKVDQIKITWEDAYGIDYELLGSINGKDWYQIKKVTGNASKENNLVDLGNIETRYVKLVGTKAANNAKYGYSIYEMEIFESEKNDLLRTIDLIKEKLTDMNVGNFHGQIKESAYKVFTTLLNNMETVVIDKSSISNQELLEYKDILSKEYLKLKKQIIKIDKSKLESVLEKIDLKLAEGYTETNSTISSWTSFIENKELAQKIFERMDVTQTDVDQAVNNLEIALDKLTFRALELSFNELVTLVNEVTKMESNYSQIMFKEMKEFIIEANKLIALGAGEVIEKDIQDSLVDLRATKTMLISYHGLQLSVDVAKNILDKNASTIRPATLKVLQGAYEQGSILVNENCKETPKLQAAKEAINDAIEGLLEIVERNDLNLLINQTKVLNETDYTVETWKIFNTSYLTAVKVNADLDATEAQISAAYADLLKGFNNLKQIVNKDTLILQIELAKQVLANKEKYDIKQVTELEKLLDQAIKMLNSDVTVEAVDEMCKTLAVKIELVKTSQKDIPVVEEKPASTKPEEKQTSVATGDRTMIYGSVVMLLIALMTTVKTKKRI